MKQRLILLLALIAIILPIWAQETSEEDSLYSQVESMPRGRERLGKLSELVRLTQ